jgi:hypothetical protein
MFSMEKLHRKRITVTLPLRVLKSLVIPEIIPTGLIVIGSCQSLKRIEWLKCVEIAPYRYLISIPTGTPIESLRCWILLKKRNEHESEKMLLLELRKILRGGLSPYFCLSTRSCVRKRQLDCHKRIYTLNCRHQPFV